MKDYLYNLFFGLKTDLGYAPDPRTGMEKAQDYTDKELVFATPLVWVEKPQSKWKHYSIRNQDGSTSCGAQGSSKAYEAMTGVIPSAHPIYRRRSNYPALGMYQQDVGNIWKNLGSTTEELDQSQNVGDDVLDRLVTVETPLKIGGYITITNYTDIDTIAQAMQTNKQVSLLFSFAYSEWTDVPVNNPKALHNLGHYVCGVDFFLYKGQKCILIDDSWGEFGQFAGQRIITEDFLKNRCFGAMYFLPLVKPIAKPKYHFNKTLRFGMMRDLDVKCLQAILTYEGFFLADESFHTGNMLQMTCNALKKWQVAHNILDFQNEPDVRKVVFGPKSIALANVLYSK